MACFLSKRSLLLLFGLLFFSFNFFSHLMKYKDILFGDYIVESNVIYDNFTIHRYLPGSRGSGERYEIKNDRGLVFSVSPGGWAYKLYANKPSLDHRRSFEAGYIDSPEVRVVFIRQDDLVFLELTEGIATANEVYKFERWFLVFEFCIVVIIFIFFVRSFKK